MSSNLSFCGQNRILNDADWICRKARKAFPAISPNRLFYENPQLFKDNERFMTFIKRKAAILKEDRADRKFLRSPFKFLKEVIYSFKEHKVAHCAEYSALAEMIARINGIENCNRTYIDGGDHSFLLIAKDKMKNKVSPQDIIVDPWLGIVGSVKDVLAKYKNDYNNLIKIPDPKNIVLKKIKELKLDKQEIEYLRKSYPKLIFKSKNIEKQKDI